MWLAGDLLFIAAIIAIVAGWMRFEERDAARADRQAATEEVAIRAREVVLAERLADQQEQHQATARRGSSRPGSGRRGRRGSAPGRRCRRRRPPRSGRRGSPGPPRSPRNASAATLNAPDGSTTSRLSSAASRTAAAISSSVTVTIASSSAERWANVRRPSAWVRVPSAIVRETRSAGQRTISPAASDSFASAASSGSTPITRAPGASARTAVATPLAEPAAADRDEDRGDVRQRPRRSRARSCPGRR